MNIPERICDILVVSPHPDDADLFCGATLAAWASAGQRVRILDLSAGELGSNGSVERRREESLRAAAALGIEMERSVLGFPDGGIDRGDTSQLAAVVGQLRQLQPALVVAPWRDDRHPDHRQASHLVRDAFFWSGVRKFEGGPGEARRPRRLLYYPCHVEAPVNCFVDVSESVGAWRKALACYESQVQRGEERRATFLNRPQFAEGLLARRRLWGERSGVNYAEAFVSEGCVALDPTALLPRTGLQGES